MSDASRPDFFEQEATHDLPPLLRAAAQYALAFVAQRHAALRPLTERTDELWLLCAH